LTISCGIQNVAEPSSCAFAFTSKWPAGPSKTPRLKVSPLRFVPYAVRKYSPLPARIVPVKKIGAHAVRPYRFSANVVGYGLLLACDTNTCTVAVDVLPLESVEVTVSV
jgi:hypothetical protein